MTLCISDYFALYCMKSSIHSQHLPRVSTILLVTLSPRSYRQSSIRKEYLQHLQSPEGEKDRINRLSSYNSGLVISTTSESAGANKIFLWRSHPPRHRQHRIDSTFDAAMDAICCPQRRTLTNNSPETAIKFAGNAQKQDLKDTNSHMAIDIACGSQKGYGVDSKSDIAIDITSRYYRQVETYINSKTAIEIDYSNQKQDRVLNTSATNMAILRYSKRRRRDTDSDVTIENLTRVFKRPRIDSKSYSTLKVAFRASKRPRRDSNSDIAIETVNRASVRLRTCSNSDATMDLALRNPIRRKATRTLLKHTAHNAVSVTSISSSTQDLGTQPKPFPFLSLPREVRDIIYSYSMESETGCLAISTSPNGHSWLVSQNESHSNTEKLRIQMVGTEDSNLSWKIDGSIPALIRDGIPTFNLSILATNKQINEECQQYLWKNNSFYGGDCVRLKELIMRRGLEGYYFRNVEDLTLPITILKSNLGVGSLAEDIAADQECFKLLGQLSQQARLKKITFQVVKHLGLDAYCRSLPRIDHWMSEMKKACAGALSKLDRKMMFYSCLTHIISEQALQNRIASLERDPTQVMDELHRAVGGELWIDDVLCYKNGQCLLQPFKSDKTSVEEWRIPRWARPEYQRG